MKISTVRNFDRWSISGFLKHFLSFQTVQMASFIWTINVIAGNLPMRLTNTWKIVITLGSQIKIVLMSISSTFYTRIFCMKVHSKPNSKQRIAAQKSFIQRSMYSFYAFRSQMSKKDSQISIVILYFWDPWA